MAEDKKETTGKGEKARHRLNAIDKEIEEINRQLDNARSTLIDIIMAVPKQAFSNIEGVNEEKSEKIWALLNKNKYLEKNGEITKKFKANDKKFTLNLSPYKDLEQDIIERLRQFEKEKKDMLDGQETRSMVVNVPKRTKFKFNCLKFYIDFTLVASDRDSQSNIKGSIIYGTSRTLCFSDCIYPNSNKQNNCERCERISRCDGLEDKPLISFEVTQHGMITSSGKLKGEWWIKDKPDLDELHYRALDLIWKEALDWANEIIVP